MAAWKKSEFFLAIPKLLVTFESTFRVLTIDNMLLNQSCITVIAMCSVIDDPPLHKILESIHDSCDLLLDSAIYTRRTRWWKGSPDYFFFILISPPPLSKSIYFSICNISLGHLGRCGTFAAWWNVSKRGNNAPLRSNPERGRGGHWTTDATFLKIASKTLLKKAFLERNSKNIPSVVSKHFSFENLLSSRKRALARKFAGKANSACIKGSTFLTHPTF